MQCSPRVACTPVFSGAQEMCILLVKKISACSMMCTCIQIHVRIHSCTNSSIQTHRNKHTFIDSTSNPECATEQCMYTCNHECVSMCAAVARFVVSNSSIGTCVCACVFVWCLRVRVLMHASVYMYVGMCMCVHTYVICTQTHACSRTSTHTRTQANMHACAHTYMQKCIQTYMHAFVYVLWSLLA